MSQQAVSESQAPPTLGADDLRLNMQRLVGNNGLMPQLIDAVKIGNEIAREGYTIARRNNANNRLIIAAAGVVLALLGVNVFYLYRVTMRIQSIQNDMIEQQTAMLALKRESRSTTLSIEAVRQNTDNIVDESKTLPKFEVVKETDKKKAERNPWKVRITPAPSAATSVIELPVSVKEAVVLPSSSATP